MAEYDYYAPNDGHATAKRNAIASVLSDLSKHPETSGSMRIVGMLALGMTASFTTRASLKAFIDGIN